MLVRSGIGGNKLFEQLWRGAGVSANQWPPCSAAEGTKGGLKVPGIAQAAGRVGAMVLVTLMRCLSLRLKPKAPAAPKMGRGPGTDDAGGWTAANVTGPLMNLLKLLYTNSLNLRIGTSNYQQFSGSLRT